MINLKIRINVDEQVLTLPVDTQFVPGISEKDPVVMVTEITEPEELKYLERDEWNIEELNFLAKRMESFDKREQSQFDAAVSIFRPKTVEALINYTYNLPRFTLISDFSTPNAIGVSHILNRKQVMSLDEMASTDFAKIGKELMQSGKGIPTAYGVLFVNEDIPFEPVYDGRHFPEYDYKDRLPPLPSPAKVKPSICICHVLFRISITHCQSSRQRRGENVNAHWNRQISLPKIGVRTANQFSQMRGSIA